MADNSYYFILFGKRINLFFEGKFLGIIQCHRVIPDLERLCKKPEKRSGCHIFLFSISRTLVSVKNKEIISFVDEVHCFVYRKIKGSAGGIIIKKIVVAEYFVEGCLFAKLCKQPVQVFPLAHYHLQGISLQFVNIAV